MARFIYVLDGCLGVSQLSKNERANHTGAKNCNIQSGH